MSLIAHDVTFVHFRFEIAHAICSKKKKKLNLFSFCISFFSSFLSSLLIFYFLVLSFFFIYILYVIITIKHN
jgi:hypothetical protein